MGMFDEETRQVSDKLVNGVNEALGVLQREVDARTPEDTKKLLQNNRIVSAQRQWPSVVGAIENDTEYAAYVEFWVKWKAYRYHKPKWTVNYIWVGARMFTRARDESQDLIRNEIDKALE